MKNNIDFFDYSLQNIEPLIDDFYVKNPALIITNSPDQLNHLMQINKELLENITAYKITIDHGNEVMRIAILKTVQSLMRNKGLNFSEFASFWAIIDVSYSAYLSLPDIEQLDFLNSVIRRYIIMRHEIYTNHGYSATTLQVGNDAKAHKTSGNLGAIKTASILNENKYSHLTDLTLDSFKKKDKIFLFSDKNGKKLFKKILNAFHIEFLWSTNRQNKMPDVLFKKKGHIYIIEHKHMKEGGGGQDKQVAEVVDFINYSELNASAPIHYITFMDGRYFNLFTRQIGGGGKLVTQIANIRRNLIANKNNYFVNTAGFYKLLKQI